MTSPSEPISALYVGGHTLVREAVRAALSRGGTRVAGALSIPEALERLDTDGPFGVALVDDDGLGERLAVETVATLTRRDPDCPVAVLSASRSPMFPVEVLRAGASGYLSKETGLDELRRAVIRLAQGHAVLDPLVTRTLLGLIAPGDLGNGATASNGNGTAPAADPAEARPHLTAVERRVLVLVTEGKVNKQIAQALGISPLTVKNHLARIRARLGAGDKAQAVAIALRAGLLD